MAAIKFTNSMNHDQILNLDQVSSIEKTGSQASLIIYFGKEHLNINFKDKTERDEVFEQICKSYHIS